MNNKALDYFSNEMLNMAINGINEAVVIKQKEVNYWLSKAQALSRKYKACLYCQSEQNYIPKLLECKNCLEKEEARKEIKNA